MQEPRTWRQYLGKILENPKEKQRLAGILEVSERTLDRWVEGISSPRSLGPLRQLLQALPNHRVALIDLLRQEFPIETAPATEEEKLVIDGVFKQIPSLFYTSVLQTYATTVEPIRSWTICNMVLQQLTKQLDSDRVGVAAQLVQCSRPVPHQKVQSLSVRFSWGTAPAQALPSETPRYYGADSLAGMAVATGLPAVVQDIHEAGVLFSVQQRELIRSAAAYPIQCAGRVAGSVLVLATKSLFFTPARLTLIQHYSYLLTLAFHEPDWYALQDIALRIMPSETVQQSFLVTFNEQVNVLLSRAEQQGQTITRSQAEQMVFQQLETAFLHLSEQGGETNPNEQIMS
jgi:hypothetical protein